MTYFDDEKKEKHIPYVIEPSLDTGRITLASLRMAYGEEEIGEEGMCAVLHFRPAIAPVKIGMLPLSRKLNEGTGKVFVEANGYYNYEFDDRGSIDKKHRRQDEIGTPFYIIYDSESEEDVAVTARNHDPMKQKRVPIAELKSCFEDKFRF